MNVFQQFSKRLTGGRRGRGIAPRANFEPPLPRPEDWLSRLADVARSLPARDERRPQGDGPNLRPAGRRAADLSARSGAR